MPENGAEAALAHDSEKTESGKGFNLLGMNMGVNINDPNSTIAEKMTSEHITMMIKATAEDDKATSKERQRGQMFNFLYMLIGLAFIVFVIVFLRNDTDLMIRIVSIVVSFVGGMGAGIAIAKRK
jgi:predicted nucleic acid-binding Zn ribbon protein